MNNFLTLTPNIKHNSNNNINKYNQPLTPR